LLPKPVTTKETEDGKGTGERFAFGVSAMQGWRRGMEDAHLALPDFDVERELGLFGVFDGHGGGAVARVASKHLPATLRGLPAFKQGRYSDALYESFLILDTFLDSPAGRAEIAKATESCQEESGAEEDEEETLRQLIESGEMDLDDLKALEAEEGEEEGMEGAEEEANADDPEVDANDAWANGSGPDGMGCTAVVALVCGGDQPQLICANAGDSRCVLARGSRALDMSQDHKPELKSEMKRIKQAGGFVSADGRVDGNLNLSRSLGDFAYKKDKSLKATEQKISGEADMRSKKLGPADQYLVLGCDGIYEKFTSQRLLDFLLPRLRRRRRHETPLSSTCSAFLDANIARKPEKEQVLGCDNMTLLVVDLQSGSTSGGAPLSVRRKPFLVASKPSRKVRRGIVKEVPLPPPARRRRLLQSKRLRH